MINFAKPISDLIEGGIANDINGQFEISVKVYD